MEILIPVLMGVGAVILLVFMLVFEKISQINRDIEYESDKTKYWHDRWDVVDNKVSKLYTKDQHDFERPKVDLHQDEYADEMHDIWKRLRNLETGKEVK